MIIIITYLGETMSQITSSLVPMVITNDGQRGERAMDIFSTLLKELPETLYKILNTKY